MNNVLRMAGNVARVLSGLARYHLGGTMPPAARTAALRLHCATNGRFSEGMAPPLRWLRPARRPQPVSGFLGTLSADRLNTITAAIRRDGFYVFESRLPDALVDELTRFAAARPAFVPGVSKSLAERYVFDAS